MSDVIPRDELPPVPQFLWDRYEDRLNTYANKREQVQEFIKKRLQKDADYGQSYEQSEYEKAKKKEVKPTLYKSGAEKIFDFSMCQIKFYPDHESAKMANKPGSICFVGYVIDRELLKLIVPFIMKVGMEYERQVVRLLSWGEGRGACELDEKVYSGGDMKGKPLKGSVNRSIKMAQKRCEVDAAIRTFSLNFGQDNEYTKDGELEDDVDSPNSKNNNYYQSIMLLLMNSRNSKTNEMIFAKSEITEYQKQAQGAKSNQAALKALHDSLEKIAKEREAHE